MVLHHMVFPFFLYPPTLSSLPTPPPTLPTLYLCSFPCSVVVYVMEGMVGTGWEWDGYGRGLDILPSPTPITPGQPTTGLGDPDQGSRREEFSDGLMKTDPNLF